MSAVSARKSTDLRNSALVADDMGSVAVSASPTSLRRAPASALGQTTASHLPDEGLRGEGISPMTGRKKAFYGDISEDSDGSDVMAKSRAAYSRRSSRREASRTSHDGAAGQDRSRKSSRSQHEGVSPAIERFLSS